MGNETNELDELDELRDQVERAGLEGQMEAIALLRKAVNQNGYADGVQIEAATALLMWSSMPRMAELEAVSIFDNAIESN